MKTRARIIWDIISPVVIGLIITAILLSGAIFFGLRLSDSIRNREQNDSLEVEKLQIEVTNLKRENERLTR